MGIMIELTGLWLNKDKEGKTYMKGSLGQGTVLIFKNEKKEEGSNQPDYKMLLAEKTKKEN
jgi:hypothetical protein|tara:strand:- start:99 stop:281 length:183 start_codon:yes stop_codon:yes gene_type:complete